MDLNKMIEYKEYNTEYLLGLDHIGLRTEIAYILRVALIRNASLYEWMILNFNDITELEKDAIELLVSKYSIIMQYFTSKDPDKKNECKILRYGDLIAEALYKYFDGKYDNSQCLALGMIASSNIAYKRNMLSMEEYYEIRDMFVPFDLPISLDSFDVDAVLDILQKSDSYDFDMENFVLLKKIGKAVTVKDVTVEELKAVIAELIVEWD